MNLSQKIIAKIEIKAVSPNRRTVNITMPIWRKVSDSGQNFVILGLFGGILIPIDNPKDETARIDEALQLFFESAEKFGKGAEKELQELGWQLKKNSIRFRVKSDTKFNIPNVPMYAGLMQTASQTQSLSLQLH